MRICAGLHSHKVAVICKKLEIVYIYTHVYDINFFNASEFGLSGIFCYCTFVFL